MSALEAEPTKEGEHIFGSRFRLEEVTDPGRDIDTDDPVRDFESARRDVEAVQVLRGLVDICEIKDEDELDDLVDMVVNDIISHFSPDYRLNEDAVSILRETVMGMKVETPSLVDDDVVPLAMTEQGVWQKPDESRWAKPGCIPL